MDPQKVKNAIVEMSNSMARVEAERTLQKEITEKMDSDEGVEKRIFKKMSTVYHKQTFSDEVNLNDEFTTLYRNLMS